MFDLQESQTLLIITVITYNGYWKDTDVFINKNFITVIITILFIGIIKLHLKISQSIMKLQIFKYLVKFN